MKRIFMALALALLISAPSAQVTTNPSATGVPAPQSAVAITGGTISGPTILDTIVAKGTWTTSGTWTLPALTLGGTISGGGRQLNNIIIGTTSPLAGAFTTGTFTDAVSHASSTANTSWVDFLKSNSGTPDQNGHYVTFTNLHAAGVGRTAGVSAGGITWRFSQPSSGAAQYAGSIDVVAETQGGASTASSLKLYSSGGVGITIDSGANTTVAGTLSVTAGGSTNKAICWKAAGLLGYCSSVVAADGSCTCN